MILKRIALSVSILLAAAIVALVLVVRFFPSIGATGSDLLRALVGDRIAAQIETVIFKAEDWIANLEYRSGLVKVSSPWQGTTPGPDTSIASGVQSGTTPATETPSNPSPSTRASASLPSVLATPVTEGKPMAPALSSPPAPWSLQSIPPLGNIAGEGVWTPYIQNASGQVVAQRTFLQADPSRPYALVAVVAFDLQKIRVHFVLGTEEPYAQAHPAVHGDGKIPSSDQMPGILLAAFNGGFKYRQGHFGAMAHGLVSAPPLNGLATLVIDPNGEIRIGAWGEDISPAGKYQAFRQNGPMAIHNGQLSQQVSDPIYWGYTINGGEATWRSGLGISQDGNTLYYFAGPYSTITSLTRAMMRAGVWNGMELDINDYWVHFDSFGVNSGTLIPQALFPQQSSAGDDRFLKSYIRDFFYITAR